MDKEDLKELFDSGISIKEIAERYSEEICILDIGIHPNYCNENRECNDCWIECLNNEFSNKELRENEKK